MSYQSKGVSSSLIPKRALHHEISCEFCGAGFSSNRYDARFCSHSCRQRNSRNEKKTPQYLLRDNPARLKQFKELCDMSPAAAEIVAHTMRAYSVVHGLEVLTACLCTAAASRIISNAQPDTQNPF